MKSLDELLKSLDLPNVTELALVSGRRPATRSSGTATDSIAGTEPLTGDEILSMLMSLGGSRYVEDLGSTPKNWTSRVVGFGVVAVSALQRGPEIQAKLTISKRDAKPEKQADPAPAARAPQPAPQAAPPPPPQAAPAPPPAPPPKASPPPSPQASPQASPQVQATSSPYAGPMPARRASQPPPSAARVEPAPARVDPAPPPRAEAAASQRIEQAPLPKIDSGLAHARTEAALRIERPSYVPASAPRDVPKSVHPAPFVNADDARAGLARFEVLITTARAKNASDLHIVAGRPPLYRVAGELKPEGPQLDAKTVENAVLPLVPARLVRGLNETGSCDFAYQSEKHGRFRVNVSRHLEGYKASLRLISRELPTIESLQLPAGVAAATKHHQGLVLFTGPTGHGKTTTLTAVVELMNRTTTHHIITVEDPVEHVQPKKKALISQREVGTHTRTFASALKGSLREDPDVIVVGELRDVETVRMAIAASETGHLVLGTMNTPSAAKTLDRLIDLFPPADQPQIRLTLAAGLRLIVSQRLVPSADRSRVHAALELLPASPPLSALIRDSKTFQIPSLQQRGKALGIVRLDESLGDLVRQKRVAIEDARVYAESLTELDAIVSGARGGA